MSRDDPVRILLLDDEPLILLDLEMAVHEAGLVALTAMDCEEAFGFIDRGPVAAAILDVNLGLNCTCAPIVRELASRGIPYVLHSGDVDHLEPWARELGGSVVPKPTPSAVVVGYLLAHIGQAAAIR